MRPELVEGRFDRLSEQSQPRVLAAWPPRRRDRRRRRPPSRRRTSRRPPRRSARSSRPRRRRRPAARCRRRACRSARGLGVILGRHRSRNFWPPKPGSTVMISTMSSSGSRSSYGSIGVAGLSAMRGPGAPLAQLAGQPHRRRGGLDVEGDRFRARLGVRRRPAVGVLDHQVDVERLVGDLARCDSTTGSAEGQVRARSGCPSRRRAARPRSARVSIAVCRFGEVGRQDARHDSRGHDADSNGSGFCGDSPRTSRPCRADAARAADTGRMRRRAPRAAAVAAGITSTSLRTASVSLSTSLVSRRCGEQVT